MKNTQPGFWKYFWAYLLICSGTALIVLNIIGRVFLGEKESLAGGLIAREPVAEIEALAEDEVAEIEADVIRLAIGHYRGRMTEVARRLGIGRSTLYRKLAELGIDSAA